MENLQLTTTTFLSHFSILSQKLSGELYLARFLRIGYKVSIGLTFALAKYARFLVAYLFVEFHRLVRKINVAKVKHFFHVEQEEGVSCFLAEFGRDFSYGSQEAFPSACVIGSRLPDCNLSGRRLSCHRQGMNNTWGRDSASGLLQCRT